jgi:hypothetical protein
MVVHGRLLFVHGVKSRDGRRVLTGESCESHVWQHANFGAAAIVSFLYRSLIFFCWLVS